MSAYVFPKSVVCFAGEIDHFLDVHDVGFDKVYHIPAGFVILIIIYRNVCVVLVPAPVFLPCERIAEKTAVSYRCECGVKVVKILVIPIYAAHVALHGRLARELAVFDHI